MASTQTTAERIERLCSQSGLTDGQVGRLMGVTTRTVHNWAAGDPMSVTNEERLARVLAVVDAIDGDPEVRRAALLDSSAGASAFHRLLDELIAWQTIRRDPLTPRERLSAV